VSQKPRDQSIFRKVEQPRFKALSEQAKANPQLEFYAVAQKIDGLELKDDYEPSVTTGGLRGTFDHSGDADGMGVLAIAENKKRLDAAKAGGSGGSQQGQGAPQQGVPGQVAGVGSGGVGGVGQPGQLDGSVAGNGAVGAPNGQGKDKDQVVPVVGVNVPKAGGEAAAPGQGNGSAEVKNGGKPGEVHAANTPPPESSVKPPAAEQAKPAGFTAENGERHTVFVKKDGGTPTIMVASTPMSVKARVDEWRTELKGRPEEDRKAAFGAVPPVGVHRAQATAARARA
jgi:hypothetical protein